MGRILPVMLLLAFAVGAEERKRVADPYVNIYHDDAVTFQVRRDLIKTVAEDQYKVWLRWLWAEPRAWKSGMETARVAFSDLDCKDLRTRELAVIHKDAQGQVLEAEEFPDAQWRSYDPDSGAAAAMRRLCEFVPELLGVKE